MSILLYLILLAFGLFALRGYLVPYLLGRFTPFRVRSISLKNIRGLEWRVDHGHNGSAPAVLKVERLGWEWCVQGHRGISLVMEQAILVLNDRELEDFARINKKGSMRGLRSKGISSLVSEISWAIRITYFCWWLLEISSPYP